MLLIIPLIHSLSSPHGSKFLYVPHPIILNDFIVPDFPSLIIAAFFLDQECIYSGL
jgi:hypothetical protein